MAENNRPSDDKQRQRMETQCEHQLGMDARPGTGQDPVNGQIIRLELTSVNMKGSAPRRVFGPLSEITEAMPGNGLMRRTPGILRTSRV